MTNSRIFDKMNCLLVLSTGFAALWCLLFVLFPETCGLYRIIKIIALYAFIVITLALVVIFFIQCKKPLPRTRSKKLGLAVFVICIVQLFYMFAIVPIRQTGGIALCGKNLSDLGKALLMYAENNHDLLPPMSNWCNSLIDESSVNKRQFVCPESFLPTCSFAFNENLDGWDINLPSDVVVLFETEGGGFGRWVRFIAERSASRWYRM